MRSFAPEAIRADFPILARRINGHPLIYFDNAATTQKPAQVLQTLAQYYTRYNANIHRSPHTLGQEATELYHQAHRKMAGFLGARGPEEIIFTRNATEAINLVAYSLSQADAPALALGPGDEVVLTLLEHHSDLVPWLRLRERAGVALRFVPPEPDGTLGLDRLEEALSARTRLVCCAHVSNVLGSIAPVKELGKLAHGVGALFLVDGAQSVPHMPVDVEEIGCDFLALSGHKMLAPMGIGVLYGRRELLEAMPPFLAGGDMISDVTLEGAAWNSLPWKFEAGTPNVAGAVALAGVTDAWKGDPLVGAIDYLSALTLEAIEAHEKELTKLALEGLAEIPEIRVYGPQDSKTRAGIVTFNVMRDGVPEDSHLVAELLNERGIAVRAGGHCAYPLADHLQVEGTVRASFYLYNTAQEVARFLECLADIVESQLI